MLRCRGFTVSISVAFISGSAMCYAAGVSLYQLVWLSSLVMLCVTLCSEICKSFVINMVIKSVVVVVFVDRI